MGSKSTSLYLFNEEVNFQLLLDIRGKAMRGWDEVAVTVMLTRLTPWRLYDIVRRSLTHSLTTMNGHLSTTGPLKPPPTPPFLFLRFVSYYLSLFLLSQSRALSVAYVVVSHSR